MDLVSDAVEALRFLTSHSKIDAERLVLMGHSEGAIILPLICKEATKAGLAPLKGCIFYAGFGTWIEESMKLQKRNVFGRSKRRGRPQGLAASEYCH